MKTLLIFALIVPLGTLAQAAKDSVEAIVKTGGDAHAAIGAGVAALGAYATSALLGLTHNIDNKVTSAPIFRKLQPVITLAGAFAAPLIAQRLGVQIDPAAWGAAPISAIAAITTAEVVGIVRRST